MSLILNTVRFGSGFFHEETRETKSGSDRDGGEEALRVMTEGVRDGTLQRSRRSYYTTATVRAQRLASSPTPVRARARARCSGPRGEPRRAVALWQAGCPAGLSVFSTAGDIT